MVMLNGGFFVEGESVLKWRTEGVAGEIPFDASDMNRLALWVSKSESIKGGPANDPNSVKGLGKREGRIEIEGNFSPLLLDREGAIGCEHDVVAALQWSPFGRNRFPRSTAHDHSIITLAESQPLKV